MTPVARPADNERLEDRRAVGRLAATDVRVPVLDERCVHVLEDGERLARLHHVLAEADHGQRYVRVLDAALDLIHEPQQSRGLVVNSDVGGLRVEDLVKLLADDVVDRLGVELAGDRVLDAIDQRQLGIPLTRLVDEAARSRARTLRLPASVTRQALVGLRECVLAIHVLERDHACRTSGDDQRDEEV
jgi:hypothetical protein